MVGYFKAVQDLLDGNKTVPEKIQSLNETLPMRYWYQGRTGKYFKLTGVTLGFDIPTPQYIEPPFPWVQPPAPVPAPPTPPRPPAACNFAPDQDWQAGHLIDFSSVDQE